MIKLVVFDWAGTTVDYGCMAPVAAFAKAFKEYGIELDEATIRKPMGMSKRDHIKTLLTYEAVKQSWYAIYNKEATEQDIDNLYNIFEKELFKDLGNYTKPKDGLLETIAYLNTKNIKVGTTSGYTKEMMDIVAPKAKEYGYDPETIITYESVGMHGRPYPYMIFENMQRFAIENVKEVIKVGDTVSDILEGKNAGAYSVGIILGSSQAGVSQDVYEQMSLEQQAQLKAKVKKEFFEAGADFVIEDLTKLPELIEMVNI